MRRFDPTARRGLVHWAITHPVGTTIISVAVCVLGLSMIGRLAVDLLPKIIYPQIMAIVAITNVNLPDCMKPTSIEDVVATAQKAGQSLGALWEEIIRGLPA